MKRMLFFLLCMVAFGSLNAQNAFLPGEKLSYVIQYKCLGIRTDVGKAVVNLYQVNDNGQRELLHAKAVGSTFKFWDSFFKVRDLYESRFYSDSIRPTFFHRDIYEGKYTIQNFYHWSQTDNSISAKVIRMNDNVKDTILPGRGDTFDLLTLFYNARNIDFEKVERGVNVPLSFVIDDEMFDIYFRYIGKEKKRIPKLGSFNTLKFAAKVVAGEVFTGKQEMIIWVTDDGNKIPLLFESPILVGSVVGRLSSCEHNKYPISSQIVKK